MLNDCKPSGTLSLLAGVTPGVHPGYSKHHIRRVRIRTDDMLTKLAKDHGYPVEFVKGFDGKEQYDTSIISFPCAFPEGTVFAKDLTAVDQLEYVKQLQTDWSDNAVSCTVYYRKEELPLIRKWLEENYETSIKSVSFLLHSDHGFAQAPLEEITEDEYNHLVQAVQPFTKFDTEHEVLTELECSGGSCPII